MTALPRSVHGAIAGSVPQLARGLVWCRSCGSVRSVKAERCLESGWPRCCGYTMTIDSPEERNPLLAASMPAITVWQPWASLIAIGAKPYEFRGWRAPRSLTGRRTAIHAGARAVRKAEVQELLERIETPRPVPPCLKADLAYPFLVRVLEGLRTRDAPLLGEQPFRLPLSSVVCTAVLGMPKGGAECAREFGGAGNDSDRDGHFNYGWPMLDVRPLVPPIEARGAQGIWWWNPPKEAA